MRFKLDHVKRLARWNWRSSLVDPQATSLLLPITKRRTDLIGASSIMYFV